MASVVMRLVCDHMIGEFHYDVNRVRIFTYRKQSKRRGKKRDFADVI